MRRTYADNSLPHPARLVLAGLILMGIALLVPDMAVAQSLTTQSSTAQSSSQPQAADTDYRFSNADPAFAAGNGPQITIHRAVSPYLERGAFAPFASLAESDGFKVGFLDAPLTADELGKADILVIANAYSPDYKAYSSLEAPSVYSAETIGMIRDWVAGGGSLLLIADHSPFAGGTIKLAEAFGFTYMTGTVLAKGSLISRPEEHIDFRREGEGRMIGRLNEHPITDGSTGRAPVSRFYTFGGQAFIPPATADNLMIVPDHYETLLTNSFFREFDTAPRIDSGGLSQGATLRLGDGRLAVFGEAGAFTAQTMENGPPIGLAHPEAGENAEFVLATLRWLAGYRPAR